MIKQIIFSCIVVSFPFISFSQVPGSSIAKYQLNSNANDYSGSGYNGTLTSVTSVANRFGVSGTASGFVAGVSTGTLPAGLVTATQNDFTLGFWFKTSMVAGSSTQWYGGNALVDAEVCGQTNDWGIALIDGGKICLGVGNPDITIKSAAAGYNNNAWHFVTATRNKTAGTIVLYADGVQVASSSGINTASLTSPSLVGLGRNPCATGGVYTGSLDDIIFYNRVLTPAEVSGMYTSLNAVVLPVKWISFTGIYAGNQVQLQWEVQETAGNDHFEIEQSADGINFSQAGLLKPGDAVVAGGNQLYHFSFSNPSGGDHFYRIRQVDKDGTPSYSKTIKLAVGDAVSGLRLQTNPVTAQVVLVNQRQALIQRLQLTDMKGRILVSRTVNSAGVLVKQQVLQLSAGLYLLTVFTATGKTSLPFIKQ